MLHQMVTTAALLLLLAASATAFKAEEFKVGEPSCSIAIWAMSAVVWSAGGSAQAPADVRRPSSQPAARPARLQNCADSAFCNRLRGNTSEAFVIVSESVKVEGGRLTAAVANTQNANASFALVLTTYSDGTLRLYINEAPEKGRFEVPDVLVPGLEQREQVCGGDGWRRGGGGATGGAGAEWTGRAYTAHDQGAIA